jgi:zinc D-Ala-D-Ala dipeptidase
LKKRASSTIALGFILILGLSLSPSSGQAKDSEWASIQPGLVEIQNNCLWAEVSQPLPYQTKENVIGMAIYPPEFRAQAKPEVIQALQKAARDLAAQGYRLVVLDAWRPSVSAAILSWKNSKLGNTNLAATPETSGHTRGLSVDVTLRTWDGKAVTMPSPYDVPSQKITEGSQRLHTAMRKAGFSRHPKEWWHFDLGKVKAAPIIAGPERLGRYQYQDKKLRIRGPI